GAIRKIGNGCYIDTSMLPNPFDGKLCYVSFVRQLVVSPGFVGFHGFDNIDYSTLSVSFLIRSLVKILMRSLLPIVLSSCYPFLMIRRIIQFPLGIIALALAFSVPITVHAE